MNLLQDFIEKTNKEGIYVKNVNSLIKRIVKSLSIKNTKLSKILGVSPSLFSKWLNSDVAIPVDSFNSLLSIVKQRKISTDKLMFSTRGGNGIRSCFIPKTLSTDLAYFIGYLLGDGCLYKNDYIISISFKESIECEKILSILNKLFFIKTKPKNYMTYLEVKINSKILHLFLSKVFGFPLGKKKGKVRTPSIILNSPPNIKINFVRGFFNADGCLCETEKTYSLMFKQSTKMILEEIKDIMLEFEIKMNGPYYDKQNDAWLLGTWKRDTINNLKDILSINAAVVQPG